MICLNSFLITPSELNPKVTDTTNTSVNYILLVQKFLLTSAVGNEVDLVVQDPMQISCFSYILRVCIFLKKTVTSTRSLPIERMTYRDMFHKNLQVSHDQILRYLLSNSPGFNHVRQLQLLQQQRTSQVKAWSQK